MQKPRFTVGIDDAGRGPVVGPMVIAGIKVVGDKITSFDGIEIKDSKELSAGSRSRLLDKIKSIVDGYYSIKISPRVIDRYVRMSIRPGGLNFLEAKAMARIIYKLKPDVAYVDASDVNCSRFCDWIRLNLDFKDVEIICEHRADSKYPIVSGASILAKVIRDREIDGLKKIYGDFGSGYVADPRTVRFLKTFFLEHGSFPPIVRKSWKTLKRLETEVRQSGLQAV